VPTLVTWVPLSRRADAGSLASFGPYKGMDLSGNSIVKFQIMNKATIIRYHPETDTMAIELRPWPGDAEQGDAEIGGEDAGDDLVIHYAPDGEP
jgi:hypothetical protein